MNGYDVLPNKLDLEEGGWPETTRTRIQRLVYVRTKHLLIGAYVIFVFVFLFVAGLQYVEQRELSLQRPEASPGSAFLKTTPDPTLPRHPHYIVFELPSSTPALIADRPLRPASGLPEYCLESYFALGYPCFHAKPTRFDIVWTWVNGSDPRLREAMADASGEDAKKFASTSLPTSKLYRDHDELRHSFRSVLQHFRPYTKQFHLITSDFPFLADEVTTFNSPDVAGNTGDDMHSDELSSEADSEEHDGGSQSAAEPAPSQAHQRLRMGQLPSWLRTEDQGRWSDGDVQINVAYQAQIFRDYTGTSFNSYSIESQFPHLRHVEQNFIYLNDDFFFTANMEPSDFFTSAHGIVLRLDPTLMVDPIPENSRATPAGEWGPLGYSSWLLSERFGSRSRPYPIHAAKSFSMPLLDEAAHLWEAEFSATAAHKFRGLRTGGGGGGDAYMSFLLTHFIIERWREALLWSWVVGRVGGDKDQWGDEEQLTAWEELGGDIEDTTRKLFVKMTERKTVENERISDALRASGQAFSGKTTYTFASADGYPYNYRTRRGASAWPKFSGDHIGQQLCTLEFDKCIGSASSASEAFKTIAFEKPTQCGDCIIHALRSSSGVLGLSAFLPSRSRTFSPSVESSTLYDQLLHTDVGEDATDSDDNDADLDSDEETIPVPHLPLVKNWAEGDFSLQGVLGMSGQVNVRVWSMRLLERYRFVIGDTNVVFLMIEGPNSATSGLRRVTSDVSLLCMNDDVKRDPELTDKILRDWQKRRWRRPAKWER